MSAWDGVAMHPGFFLTLDGLDGAGKTTQCKLLAAWLRAEGYEVVQCRDPGSTVLGDKIRTILLDTRNTEISRRCEMLLFMAARAQMTDERIRPALEGGKVVLSDRYLLANLVYQGYAGGLDVEMLRQVGLAATGGLLPDLTVVLDLDLAQAGDRLLALLRPRDRMELQDDDYHRRVRDGFLTEARRHPELIRCVRADADAATVHARIRHLVAPLLREKMTAER